MLGARTGQQTAREMALLVPSLPCSCSGHLEAQREPRGERAAEDVGDITRRTAGPGESTKFARREPPTGPPFSDVDFAE